jgi:hypothetical protein
MGSQTMGILRSNGLPTTPPGAVQPVSGAGAAAGTAGSADSNPAAGNSAAGSNAVAGSAARGDAASGSSSGGLALPVSVAIAAAAAVVLGFALVQRRRRTIAA